MSEAESLQSLSPTLGFQLPNRIRTEYGAEVIHSKVHRDYFEGSIKQLNLCQIDPSPNFHIGEAKWDLFKITISDGAFQSVLAQCEAMLQIKSTVFLRTKVIIYLNFI